MLRNRLLFLVLLVLLPAFALVWRSNLVQQRMEIRAARANILATARIAASSQDSLLRHSQYLLTNLTEFPFLTLATDRAFCEWHLANLKLLQPHYADFGLIESDGELFCTALKTNYPQNFSDDAWFQAVLRSDRFSVGSFESDPLSGEPVLRLGCPVKDTNGVTVRVLYGSLRLAPLASALTELPLPEEGSVLVVDRNGTVVTAHPGPDEWQGQSLTSEPYWKQIAGQQEGVLNGENSDGVKTSIAISPMDIGADMALFVLVKAPQQLLLAGAKDMLKQNLWLMLVVGLCVLGFAWLFTNRTLLQPIDAMHQAALRLGQGDLTARTGIPRRKTEIHELAGVLDAMAEKLADRDMELRQIRESLEVQVERRTAELEAANKELEAFSYSVSHDLQTPLRHIDAYASILQEQPEIEGNEETAGFVQRIQHSANRMSKLIQDLLEFSRMTNQSLHLIPCDFNQLVKEVVEDSTLNQQDRVIRWKVQKLPTAVPCDVSMFRQVWSNLISNAIKYTRHREEAQIEIGFREAKDAYTFFVQDNGTGFDMKYAGKLFAVFQRLHHDREFEGTGIGLANVRRIVGRHHGRTWAEGRLNDGATFYFTIPKPSGSRASSGTLRDPPDSTDNPHTPQASDYQNQSPPP